MRALPVSLRTLSPSLRSAIAALLATSTGLCLAVPAWSQTTEPAPPDVAAPAAEPAKAPETKPEPEKAPDVSNPTSGGDLYGLTNDDVPPGGRIEWARRRDIRVVQKRSMLKEARHSFSLLAGVVPNDDFYTYVVGGLGYAYYLSEDLAITLHGAYTFDQQTSLQSSLTAPRPEGPGLEVRLPQKLQGLAVAGIDWNLMHGKIGYFSTRLTEFDIALSFGVGAVRTGITNQGDIDPKTLAQIYHYQFDPAGALGAGVLFYLSNSWALRLDYHQYFYPALRGAPGGGGVSYPIAGTIAVTYFTDAPQ